jgi:hypothetical protein
MRRSRLAGCLHSNHLSHASQASALMQERAMLALPRDAGIINHAAAAAALSRPASLPEQQPRRGKRGTDVGAAHACRRPVCQACVCRLSQPARSCPAALRPWLGVVANSTRCIAHDPQACMAGRAWRQYLQKYEAGQLAPLRWQGASELVVVDGPAASRAGDLR